MLLNVLSIFVNPLPILQEKNFRYIFGCLYNAIKFFVIVALCNLLCSSSCTHKMEISVDYEHLFLAVSSWLHACFDWISPQSCFSECCRLALIASCVCFTYSIDTPYCIPCSSFLIVSFCTMPILIFLSVQVRHSMRTCFDIASTFLSAVDRTWGLLPTRLPFSLNAKVSRSCQSLSFLYSSWDLRSCASGFDLESALLRSTFVRIVCGNVVSEVPSEILIRAGGSQGPGGCLLSTILYRGKFALRCNLVFNAYINDCANACQMRWSSVT